MAIQQITLAGLSGTFGGSERFWREKRKLLVSAGLVNKIGRSFFGDLTQIAQALAKGGDDIWKAQST